MDIKENEEGADMWDKGKVAERQKESKSKVIRQEGEWVENKKRKWKG